MLGLARTYYVAWMYRSRRIAEELISVHNIDVYHHLTFACDWLPCFPPRNSKALLVRGPVSGYSTSREIADYVDGRSRVLDLGYRLVRRLFLLFTATTLEGFDLVLTNNGSFTSQIRRHVPNTRITEMSTQTMDPIDVCAAWSPKAEIPNLLIGGRLLYWKGFDVFIQLLAALDASGMRYNATIVGWGSQRYMKKLKSATMRLQCPVTFLPRLTQREFHNEISSCSVFVYPSFYGTGDSVMAEVVQLGRPIVCFPSEGAREFLGDYKYIAHDFSIMALKDALVRALGDIGGESFEVERNRIVMQHSRDSKIQNLTELYCETERRV